MNARVWDSGVVDNHRVVDLRVEDRMQTWMWLVIGLTVGAAVVGLLVILIALMASRGRT
ncbi:MAG: hypothetical protein WCC38_07245 [Pseudonocardiaceae bacterium]